MEKSLKSSADVQVMKNWQQRQEKAVDEMYQAVLDAGWDGEWFLRAYDAQSEKVGSKECEEGKIFIEPQGLLCYGRYWKRRGTGRKSIGFCT
mgnify:CR=1 FL=1